MKFRIQRLFRLGDPALLISVVLLITIGVIMIFSTSPVIGYSNFGDSYYFIKKHLIYLAAGYVALLIGRWIPVDLYRHYVMQGFFLSIFCVVLTLIPGVGVRVGGASRWLHLGFVTIQPVELLKFFVLVFLSVSLDHKRQVLGRFQQGLLPILMMLVIPLLCLGLQPDLGNILLILGVSGVLFFLSAVPVWTLASMGLVGLMGVIGSILINPYQLTRIHSFLSPWSDPTGKNYHIIQSFIAIGSGGFLGLGLGQSKLKYFYVPLHYSDFIFSILCEEGGMVLAVVVLLLFGVVFYRGIMIAASMKSDYPFYLGVGLTCYIVIQALLNIAVVIGVVPVTGIPLTFISFGGTSLVMSMFFVGILLQLSRLKPINSDGSSTAVNPVDMTVVSRTAFPSIRVKRETR